MISGGVPVSARCPDSDACPAAAVCVETRQIPCAGVSRGHRQQLVLCDALEGLADALPSRMDRLTCLQIANELVPLLRASQRYEEQAMFTAFEARGCRAAAGARSIRRLKAEHIEDECAALDVTEALLAIGHGGGVDNPEALGFMLRAFFGTLRRHIAFEREHVLPAVTGLG